MIIVCITQIVQQLIISIFTNLTLTTDKSGAKMSCFDNYYTVTVFQFDLSQLTLN